MAATLKKPEIEGHTDTSVQKSQQSNYFLETNVYFGSYLYYSLIIGNDSEAVGRLTN
jgi:hypothetical protein